MKTRTGYFVKRNGIYYVAWKVNGKSFMKSTGTRNKREAEKKRAEIMAPFVVGDEVDALKAVAVKLKGKQAELAQLEDKKNPPLKIKDTWREYVESTERPDSGESTLTQYEFQFNDFTRWIEEKHPTATYLREVTRTIADQYAKHLIRRGLSANTYNKYLNLLTLVFRVVKSAAKLSENPWETIRRKRQNPEGRRELTIDELRKVCQKAEGESRTLFALGIYTGMRLGDCATLRWGEVDLHRNIIRRIPSKTARRNAKPIIVPIHPVLAGLLSEISLSDRGEYVLPETAQLYDSRIDLVTDMIQRHFESCEIRTQKPGTGKGTEKRAVVEVGFHSLRHTFVSLCRESNAPLAVVESIVGHSNPAMTRHYTHTSEEAAVSAVGLLPDITGGGEKVLPAPAEIERSEEIRDLVKSMNSKNWRKVKKGVLARLA